MNEEYKNIQSAVDGLLNIKSFVRRKAKRTEDKRKDLFLTVINGLEQAMIRTNIAFVEIGVDYSNYDDMFLTVIDALIYMQFGNEAAELISFYLFDRINPDGTINPIIDQDDVEIEIKDATHLWEIISRFDPKL